MAIVSDWSGRLGASQAGAVDWVAICVFEPFGSHKQARYPLSVSHATWEGGHGCPAADGTQL